MSVEGNVDTDRVLRGKVKEIPAVDKTLTKENHPADAKTAGGAIKELQASVNKILEHLQI